MSNVKVVGIDIGGTLARAGMFAPSGTLLAMEQMPMEPQRGPKDGLKRLAGLVRSVLARAGGSPEAIGIGCTGPLDPIRGTINNPYTLPTWENVPISAYLSEQFQVPVYLENDADAAALGEYWQGAGKGAPRLYAVTVGTGLGTALVLNGEIYRGIDGAHPEGGHHIVDPGGPLCYCGAHGCWEILTAGPAIARRAREAILQHPHDATILLSMGGGDPAAIEGSMVSEAARQGDPLATRVMHAVARDFATGLVNIITLFLPDVVVLGGGVMKNAALFLPEARKMLHAASIMAPTGKIQLHKAKLGTRAGLYGAAYRALQTTPWRINEPHTA